MAYTSQITYPIYDLNSTEFMEVVRELLQIEMLNQRTAHGKAYLPQLVKGDDYLVNPISDTDINPAFCSITKAKMESTDHNFPTQQNNMNYYIISLLAKGIDNLRKIADAIYIILNDLDIKMYLSLATSTNGDKLLYTKSSLEIKSLSTEIEERKTVNEKDVVYGNLVLQAQITEVVQKNTYPEIEGINEVHEIGSDEKEITQITNY